MSGRNGSHSRAERNFLDPNLDECAGLDPQREESGDIAREKTISKQGNAHIRSVLYDCVTAAIRNSTNPPVRKLYDRRKERGKHQKVAEVACMRKLLAIVYGRKGNNERFDPTYEKRLKARQEKKRSAADSSGEENAGQSFDMSAPVSRKEAKKRRKATSPEKSGSPHFSPNNTPCRFEADLHGKSDRP